MGRREDGTAFHQATAPRAPPPARLAAALEKALEARKRERQLARFRETRGVADYGGPELGYAAELQVRRAGGAARGDGSLLALIARSKCAVAAGAASSYAVHTGRCSGCCCEPRPLAVVCA